MGDAVAEAVGGHLATCSIGFLRREVQLNVLRQMLFEVMSGKRWKQIDRFQAMYV